MESFFKKASLEYFNKLKETQSSVDRMKTDQMSSNNMVNKVSILEQEIVDLKNQQKTRIDRNDKFANERMEEGVAARIDLLIEEINQLWSFV